MTNYSSIVGFKGQWDYNPDCDCPKCENHWNMLADCVGDARSMEEGGASPDRPVKGWRLDHRAASIEAERYAD